MVGKANMIIGMLKITVESRDPDMWISSTMSKINIFLKNEFF